MTKNSPKKDLPRRFPGDSQDLSESTCPRCKSVVSVADRTNAKGDLTWCSDCRRKRVEFLINLGKVKAPPMLAEPEGSESSRLQLLINAAMQAGAWKHKALTTPKGFAKQKAWSAHFKSMLRVKRLSKELAEQLQATQDLDEPLPPVMP